MRIQKHAAILLALLLAGAAGPATLMFLAPSPARAQGVPPAGSAGAPEDAEVFGEVIDVHVVNREVVVMDRDGRRVAGLKPTDFRLLVDGKPARIEYFTEVAGGRATAEGTGGSSPAAGGA